MRILALLWGIVLVILAASPVQAGNGDLHALVQTHGFAHGSAHVHEDCSAHASDPSCSDLLPGSASGCCHIMCLTATLGDLPSLDGAIECKAETAVYFADAAVPGFSTRRDRPPKS